MRRAWKRARKSKKRKASSQLKKTRAPSLPQSKSIHDVLALKKSKFVEKCQQKQASLVLQISRLRSDMGGLGDERMHILHRKIFARELKDAESQLAQIQNGSEMREFETKLNSFRRVQQEIERKLRANPSIALEKDTTKRAKRSQQKRPSNQRKTASHNRDVRVSSGHENMTSYDVLMDEISEEFGDDNEEKEEEILPIVYVCNRNYCPDCKDTLLMKLPQESCLACPKCGVTTSYLDSTAAATGHSDDRSFNQFSYQRTNHFLQWLRCVQGKESVTIPDEILQNVCYHLAAKRIAPTHVTAKRVRECLKLMRMRKYYENVVLITSVITGKKPPRFTPQVEETLQRLFQKVQAPFEIAVSCICPQRKNFLSYSFILTKLCGLLQGSVDRRWLESWPTLKGRDKIARSDKIWSHICAQLGWKFYPSI